MTINVLLIQPNYRLQKDTGAWGTNPPLGLCYIAAVMEENNIHVKILDANALNLDTEKVLAMIATDNYNIIGISFMTPAHNFAARIAKSLGESILKVAGGPQPTAIPEEVLKDGFDVVVRGEGEKAMLEIAQGKPLKDILGISYKENEKIIHNPNRPLMTREELDKLPFPARHLLPNNGVDEPYKSAGTQWLPWSTIFMSRGCPYNCYYCNKRIFGQVFNTRSPENILEEILFLREKYGIKELDIMDDCFNFDLNFANKVMDMIIEKNLGIHIRFSNGVRADKINEELMKKFKKAGVEWLPFGIESGNQEVMNKIPKGLTLEQAKQAIKITKKFKIRVIAYMIFGLLGDTRETMQQTINFVKETDVDVAQFTMMTPYPGTRIWDEIKKNGKLLVTNWDDFHHTSTKMTFTHPDVAPPEVVEEMYQKAHREFYFRPRYILRTLLGIRSIGDIRLLFSGMHGIMNVFMTRVQGESG